MDVAGVMMLKKLRASWIVKHYLSRFRTNPYWKLHEIKDTIWQDWGIHVTMYRCHTARMKAQSLILGLYKEQYELLGRYAAEVIKSNPNNTAKLHLEGGVFQKIYFCFNALKQGFLDGCRPFIGLDGCFLKGPYGGQLLTAVGRDGNNQMFPIAWAVVDVENTENWTWFLELLSIDLRIMMGAGYTVMSDQQKGLMNAISKVWPEAEQRICARHVYTNFRGVFGSGHQYRLAFWRIAKCTTQNQYNEAVKEFQDLDIEAANDVVARDPEKWCRANFGWQSQCDSVDNNMCEAFNSYILGHRHKPIISMLENMKDYLMVRHHKKRDEISKKDIVLCPRIQLKLEKIKENCRGWTAFWDGAHKYGVRYGVSHEKFVVDLNNAECSCRTWQLSGIPCVHAITAIWMKGEEPEHYVSVCYSKEHFLRAYAYTIDPLPGLG